MKTKNKTKPVPKKRLTPGQKLGELTRKIIQQDGGDHNIRAMAGAVETMSRRQRIFEELMPRGRRRAYAFANPQSWITYQRIVTEMARGRPAACRLVLILGEHGAGKTHLATRLQDLAYGGAVEPLPLSQSALWNHLIRRMGNGVILYDNVGRIPRGVNEGLCKVWNARSGKHGGLESTACCWLILTGNDVGASEDLMRRADVIELKRRA